MAGPALLLLCAAVLTPVATGQSYAERVDAARERVAALAAEPAPEEDLADALVDLAELLQEDFQLAAAEAAARRAASLRRHSLGTDDPATVEARILAARVRAEYDLPGGALELEEAIAAAEAVAGPESRLAARGHLALARAHLAVRSPATAAGPANRAVEALEASGAGDDDLDLAVARILAMLVESSCAKPTDRSAFWRSAAVVEGALGRTHPEAIRTRAAGLRFAVIDVDDETVARRAGELVAERERVYGPDHPRVGYSLVQQGLALTRLGRLDEGRALIERAVGTCERRVDDIGYITADFSRALAVANVAADRLDAAEELLDAATPVLETHAGDESGLLADALQVRADLEAERARYDDAIAAQSRCVAIRRVAWGPSAPLTASALDTLAALHRDTGDLARALDLRREVLAVRRAYFGDDSVAVANSLNNIATLEESVGDLAAARDHYVAALEAYERHLDADHPFIATVLSNLTWIRLRLGEFDAAEASADRSLGIRLQRFGPSSTILFWNWCQLGRLALATGRPEEALEHFQTARELFAAVHGASHPNFGSLYADLACAKQRLGRLNEALDDATRAIAICEDAGPGWVTRRSYAYVVRADVLARQGKLAEAERDARRSIAALESEFGADHPDTANGLDLVGRIAFARGDFAAAEDAFGRAIAVRTKIAANGIGALRSRVSRAAARAARGELDDAIEDVAAARARLVESFGEEHPDVVTALANEATFRQWRGDMEDAGRLYERAQELALDVLGASDETAARIVRNHAAFRSAVGEADRAWALLRAALGATRDRVVRLLSQTSETDALLYSAREREVLEELLAALEDAPTDEREDDYYAAFVRWKGQVFRGHRLRVARLEAALDEDGRRTVDELRSVQATLSSLVADGGALRDDERERVLDELRERRSRLEVELARSVPVAIAEREVAPAEIAAELPEGTALVDFFVHRGIDRNAGIEDIDPTRTLFVRGDERVTAWVLTRGAEHAVRVPLGASEPIRAAVAAYLEGVREERGLDAVSGPRASDRAERLRSLLWDPIEPHLEGARRVVVAPDRYLATLPFETLEEDGSYLVERYGFAYVQNVRSVVDPDRGRAFGGPPELLVVGGVDYWADPSAPPESTGTPAGEGARRRGRPGVRWAPLSAARAEVDALESLHRRLWPGGTRTVLRGADATEARLKAELPEHRIAHLATHGYFAPGDTPSLAAPAGGAPGALGERLVVGYLPGLLSGVVCAGANVPREGPDNGLLTAEEVGWLDLAGCDLVVLSACETALGTARGGEGLMSLQRALHRAGARTVVSSVWRVRDEETRDLMERFYSGLWELGLTKAQALRAAQLWLLDRNRERYGRGRPFTWGAFVLSGEPD